MWLPRELNEAFVTFVGRVEFGVNLLRDEPALPSVCASLATPNLYHLI